MALARPLTPSEARILGSLIEKEATTPDYYPLSLNALANACNQKNNREPVTNLDEEAVRQALHGLEDLGLAGAARSDGRVAKYEHSLGEAFNFSRAETALLCVLLLRGPQTPGELRGRTERMHRFEELPDVLAGLQKLMDREPALAMLLPRQPGSREARYTQLLTGPPDAALLNPAFSSAAREAEPREPIYREPVWRASGASQSPPEHETRVAQLEAIVAQLQQEVASLRQRIDDIFGD